MQPHEPGGRGALAPLGGSLWAGGFYFSILGGFCAFFVTFLVSLLAAL